MKKIQLLSIMAMALFTLGYGVNASAATGYPMATPTQEVVSTNLEKGVKITPQYSVMTVGQEQTLTASVTPENTTQQKIWWFSSNNRIATIQSDGKITALSEGTVLITAISSNGRGAVATIRVTQQKIEATGVSITPNSPALAAGKKLLLNAKVTPDNASNKLVTWSSSNTDIVTVNAAGLLTGIQPGTASITATTHNGLSTTTQVVVEDGVIEASAVIMTKPAQIVAASIGETLQLEAKVLPENVTDNSLTWSSSNSSVASVTSTGSVTFHRFGWVTIFAQAHNGRWNSITYIVTALP